MHVIWHFWGSGAQRFDFRFKFKFTTALDIYKMLQSIRTTAGRSAGAYGPQLAAQRFKSTKSKCELESLNDERHSTLPKSRTSLKNNPNPCRKQQKNIQSLQAQKLRQPQSQLSPPPPKQRSLMPLPLRRRQCRQPTLPTLPTSCPPPIPTRPWDG